MIPEFGLVCLILALMMSLVQAVVAPVGLLSQRFAFCLTLSKPAAFGQSFFVVIGFFTLMSCFVQDDFTLSYIAQNSNANLPLVYKICAVWGAHEGSLLLWSLILALWTVAVAAMTKALPKEVSVLVLSILGAISIGFLLLLLQTSNPFARLLPFSPNEGADLNPLLQDPGFVLHPPFLYMGYVGLAVPFAFAITAMLLKNKQIPWAAWARPWALLAWSFLTVGITLGSWWAYYELGWGGWWFWDPVENASFMPWLVGAALGHALLITSSSKEKLFNSWSLLLALSAFILSLIGTFLVRSGVVSSVHAFASDPSRGTFILGFLALVVMLSFGLFMTRGIKNQAISRTSAYSRESLMLLGNVILYVATLTVLLGTLYPIFIEVLKQERLSVGPPYFNSVFIPIMLPLLGLMAIAPHIKWREDTIGLLWPKIKIGLLLLPIVIVAIYFLRDFPIMSTVGILFGGWVIVATLLAVWKLKTTGKLILSRWGMILAHFGIGLAVLGIALTTTLETEKDLKMSLGDTITIQDYEFVFKDLKDIQGPNYEGIQATFVINQHQKLLCKLYPEKRFFIPRNTPMTETAIYPGLFRDFYIALGERLEDGSWTVRLYIKPFIRFIWLGGLLIALGAFISSLVAFRQTARGTI